MEVTSHVRLAVADASGVGEARRVATRLGRDHGLAETDVGRVALIVTEAATNLVKHAGGGELLLASTADGRPGLGVLALDRGPGMRNVGEALRDGYSTSGTPGTGLGAISRLASVFDVYSVAGAGTALFVGIGSAGPGLEPHGLVAGGVNVPHPAEEVSGDAWAISPSRDRARLLVADGLGHGVRAAEASALAARVFAEKAAEPSTTAVLERIHDALRPTRGAAVAIVELDRARRLVRFSGIGNIAGTIVGDGGTRSVVSQHGTAGHDVRRIQEFTYPWPAAGLLVLHSDGLISHWTLDAYPGLARRHPALVAGVLYRDFRRGRDDTTVVVVREAV
ncbi:MAG TPA: ATP-binding SpoIIE family protein phosphatase [Gaiellaceae bacterium]|nr:ATP-binding SpoIIE family protein phosphatase [Gaiellaceae bacterium]